jgi:hypothetical protein
MARSQVAAGGADKTAPPRESARSERARVNRLEAQSRATEKNRGAKGETQLTEDYFSRRSQNEHAENPDKPGDSTVRHALPQTGADSSGQKGFPQGEYDVIEPAKAAAKPKRNDVDALIDQHIGQADPTEVIKNAEKKSRLNAKERFLILETTQPGFVLEHEGDNRWRARSGNRFGFGASAIEALESFVLGQTSGPDAGTEAFLALPASQQKEIRERDEKAARALGTTYESSPEAIARKEALETSKILDGAEPAAANANTDGPERASALSEARQKSATKKPATKKAAAKKSGAKRK